MYIFISFFFYLEEISGISNLEPNLCVYGCTKQKTQLFDSILGDELMFTKACRARPCIVFTFSAP